MNKQYILSVRKMKTYCDSGLILLDIDPKGIIRFYIKNRFKDGEADIGISRIHFLGAKNRAVVAGWTR